MDFERRRVAIELGDGQWQEFPAPESMLRAGAPFRGMSFDLQRRELGFVLPDGERIAVEIGRPASDTPPGGVPVIYLDQLHWVGLSRAHFAPEKLPAEHLAAAQR